MKVNLSLVDHPSCNSLYTSGTSDDTLHRGVIDEWHVCAGEVGKDTCQVNLFGQMQYQLMYFC